VESSCKLGNEPSGCINAGNYREAAQVVASRAVLSSTELVSGRSALGHWRFFPCHLMEDVEQRALTRSVYAHGTNVSIQSVSRPTEATALTNIFSPFSGGLVAVNYLYIGTNGSSCWRLICRNNQKAMDEQIIPTNDLESC
jgi:hypothetical protein